MPDKEESASEFFESGRLRVQRLKMGDGRPLLYLHSVCGELLDLPFFRALAQDRELHVPAAPGFGASPDVDDIRDVEDLVYHYLDYCDAHDWRSVDLVGSCFGGWIAAEIAARNPERVKSLTLIGAAGLRLDEAPTAELFGLGGEQTRSLLFARPDSDLARFMEISPAAQAIGLSKPVPLPLYRNQTAVARFAWAPYFHNPKLSGRLARITAPTLVLWGDDDVFIPRAHALAYQERIRGARLHTLPSCGHIAIADEPNASAELVRRHLEAASS